jgi:GLPGLI family protein
MKTLYLIGATCLMLHVSRAQNGTVYYDEKVKLEIHIDSAEAMNMPDFPKERILHKELFFTGKASFYEDREKPEKQEVDENEGGNHMVIKMDVPDDKVYCDLENRKVTERRDFMSRLFLVESDMGRMTWKLTGNHKDILGYPCQEAVLQDTTKKMVVWFTPAIPVATGPNGYGNLPGLILEVVVNDGKISITATHIELKDFDTSVMVKPKDGKKVSRDEFNKIVADKRKEMQEENGGKGDVIIRIRN